MLSKIKFIQKAKRLIFRDRKLKVTRGQYKFEGMFAVLIFFILVLIIFPSSEFVYGIQTNSKNVSESTGNCREIRTVEVEGREFIGQNAKYRKLKKELIQQCLVDAVKQTLGTQIRSNIGMSTTQNNDDLSEKYQELSSDKASTLDVIFYSVYSIS